MSLGEKLAGSQTINSQPLAPLCHMLVSFAVVISSGPVPSGGPDFTQLLGGGEQKLKNLGKETSDQAQFRTVAS